jgi:hypothetical protein
MSNLIPKYEHHLQPFWDGLQPGDLIAVARDNSFHPGVFRKYTSRVTKAIWVKTSSTVQIYWEPEEHDDQFVRSYRAFTQNYSGKYIEVEDCPERLHYYDLTVWEMFDGSVQLPTASYTQSDSYHRVLPYPLEMLSAPEFQIYNHIRELMQLPPVKRQK